MTPYKSTAQKLAGRADALLFLEPACSPSAEPIVDGVTCRLTAAWRARRSGKSFRGVHENDCDPGIASDNRDHYLRAASGIELLTHSLCIRYVAHFRHALPTDELAKISLLPAVFVMPTTEELAPGTGRRDPRRPAGNLRGDTATRSFRFETTPNGSLLLTPCGLISRPERTIRMECQGGAGMSPGSTIARAVATSWDTDPDGRRAGRGHVQGRCTIPMARVPLLLELEDACRRGRYSDDLVDRLVALRSGSDLSYLRERERQARAQEVA
jgi:hypothetical protein